MRKIVLALTLGLVASLGGATNAADLFPGRGGRPHVSYGADNWPRLRVVEQAPYCGDCEDPIGRPSFPVARLRYIGYLPWTRGCALGGCYGYYGVYGGCYWQDVRGPGGQVIGAEKICN